MAKSTPPFSSTESTSLQAALGLLQHSLLTQHQGQEGHQCTSVMHIQADGEVDMRLVSHVTDHPGPRSSNTGRYGYNDNNGSRNYNGDGFSHNEDTRRLRYESTQNYYSRHTEYSRSSPLPKQTSVNRSSQAYISQSLVKTGHRIFSIQNYIIMTLYTKG